MSEFDTLKNDAEHYAQQHPEQVKKGEEEIEKKFGVDQQGPGQQQDSAQQGSGQQQDQSGQTAATGGDAGQGAAGQ